MSMLASGKRSNLQTILNMFCCRLPGFARHGDVIQP
jgi:hypothetical protein